MKNFETRNTIRSSSGSLQTIECQIQNSAKATQILVRDLYSNIIRAIVRELSTNAYDAQVEQGLGDKPFDVHLPTKDECNFVIRDYGGGIDLQRLNDIYSKIFESDKIRSNDVVGCLGLGSKTPFGYADSFTIESYIDGKLYIYNAYINERGTPAIDVIVDGTTTTDKPNGTRICVPVKYSDMNKWYEEARFVYSFFDVKPNFLNNHNVDILKYDYSFSNDDFGIIKRLHYDSDMDSYAIMGNVAYRISSNNFSQYIHVFNSFNVHLFFNIGELNIEAGRENLHYNDKTIRNIERKLKATVEHITKEINDNIAASPNYYEAILRRKESLQKIPHGLHNFIDDKWNGKALTNSHINSPNIDFVSEKYKEYNNYSKQGSKGSRIYPTRDKVFVKRDTLKNCSLKSRYLANQKNKTVILLEPDAFDEFLDFYGLTGNESMLYLVSDLPDAPDTYKRQILYSVTTPVMRFKQNTYTDKVSYFWKSEDIDLSKEKGFYVEFYRYYVKYKGQQFSPVDVKNTISLLEGIGHPPIKNIFAIKSKHLENVDTTNLQCFVKYAIDYIKKNSKQNLYCIVETQILNALKKNFSDFLTKEEKTAKHDNNAAKLLQNKDLFGGLIQPNIKVINGREVFYGLQKKEPIFNLISPSELYYSNTVKIIKQYIEAKNS